MIHPYDPKYTEEIVHNLNDRVQKTEKVRAFIMIDDVDRKVGLDRSIKDSIYLSRLSTTEAEFLEEEIMKYKTPIQATFHQHFEPLCSSYYTMDYLLAAFLAIQVVFTLPYVILSQKWQNHIPNMHGLAALEKDNRSKFSMWIYMIHIFLILQTIALMLLTSECPLEPMSD